MNVTIIISYSYYEYAFFLCICIYSTHCIYPLSETSIAPENGWLEYIGILISFWDGLFSEAMLVSGSVYIIYTYIIIFVQTYQKLSRYQDV